LDEALRLDPNDADAHIDRGVALGFINEHRRALADYDEAIRLNPKQPLGYVNRGTELNALGNRAAAIASIQRALEIEPNYPPAVEGLKQIGASGGRDKRPAQAGRAPSEGEVAACMSPTADISLPEGAIKRVIAACTVLIKSGGGDNEGRAIAFLQRGSMYRRIGKFELALADFSESLRYRPDSADAYTGRANAHRGLGQLDAAIADHSEAIRLKPDFAMAYSNRGNVYSDKKDYQRAIADYDEALKRDPHYAAAFYNRAIAREDSGDKDGAIADYREALRLRPGMKQAADALKELGVKP
jgi:tetratricopeptide (TPR) repeat protein